VRRSHIFLDIMRTYSRKVTLSHRVTKSTQLFPRPCSRLASYLYTNVIPGDAAQDRDPATHSNQSKIKPRFEYHHV